MLLGSSVLSNNKLPQTHIAINYIRSLFWYEISNNLDKNKKVSFFEHCVPMEGCFGVRRSMQLQSKTDELRQRPHISTSFNCHTFVHPPSLSPFPPCHTSGGGVTKKKWSHFNDVDDANQWSAYRFQQSICLVLFLNFLMFNKQMWTETEIDKKNRALWPHCAKRWRR